MPKFHTFYESFRIFMCTCPMPIKPWMLGFKCEVHLTGVVGRCHNDNLHFNQKEQVTRRIWSELTLPGSAPRIRNENVESYKKWEGIQREIVSIYECITTWAYTGINTLRHARTHMLAHTWCIHACIGSTLSVMKLVQLLRLCKKRQEFAWWAEAISE